MEPTKKCQQCGEVKLQSEFRPYYRMKGYYKSCKDCESLNQRRKYLKQKLDNGKASEEEQAALTKIDELYAVLRSQGLKPPSFESRGRRVLADIGNLDAEIQRRSELVQSQQSAAKLAVNHMIQSELAADYTVPPELAEWLAKDLTGMDPEELQDNVMEYLNGKYRPQTGVDAEFKPQYDDTHRTALNAIQKRFDEYEDDHEY